MLTMAVFMLEMLKLSKMFKPSRDDLTSSMKTSNMTDAFTFLLLGASQRRTQQTNLMSQMLNPFSIKVGHHKWDEFSPYSSRDDWDN